MIPYHHNMLGPDSSPLHVPENEDCQIIKWQHKSYLVISLQTWNILRSIPSEIEATMGS